MYINTVRAISAGQQVDGLQQNATCFPEEDLKLLLKPQLVDSGDLQCVASC